MSTSKNLDRLFTESFKEFEVTPPKESWGNIKRDIALSKEKILIDKNINNLYSKIFYVTASFCFLTITAGIANYIYNSNMQNNKIEKVYYEKSDIDFFKDYELINKTDFQTNLIDKTELLNFQLNNRKKSVSSQIIKSKQKDANILDNQKLEPSPTKDSIINEIVVLETAESHTINNENMIVDESIGKTMNEKDIQKIENAENVAEGTIVVTSNGNRVLRINTNKKTVDPRNYTTKIDSTSLTADELKLINQNKKRLKVKN